MNDIKKKINEIVEKVKNDKIFAKEFKDNPIKTVEDVIGIDLPDEKIKEIVLAVRTKLNLDKSGILGKIKGLLK